MAIKVTLRRKAMSGSRESLYLDFYPAIKSEIPGKETRRQFLNMYLYKGPKTPADRQHNKETLSQAEFLKQKRTNEVNKPEIYSGYELEQLRVKELGTKSFIDYYQKLANKQSGTTKEAWESVLIHLKQFGGDHLTFDDITEVFCNDFKEYLLTQNIARSGKTKLSSNSASVYFSKLKAAVKRAYKDKMIISDLNIQLDNVPSKETRRNILTLNEVNAIIRTECNYPVFKKASIFSIYTGLRFSDIQKLTWGEIEEKGPGDCVINFKQKKTQGIEALPIPDGALQLIGERKAAKDKVFDGLEYSAHYNKALAKWVGLAGITKNITFHCFRHTYATLQLSMGTDIHTLSKLLGHRDVKTTLIYTKYIDDNKRAAANRIQLDIDNLK